ncbi:MAG TPA: hypothetical protein VFV66_33995, partial [Nonomuraea sp.]|nr:hypothetical protein [Nonomuraea sp.]
RQVELAPSLSAWDGGYLPRPLFVDEHEVRAFAADLRRLVEVLLSLPDRLFDGDLRRFAEAVGVRGERGALMTRLGAVPPVLGRADVHHDGTAFRLLEIGIGSELGGWDRSGEGPRAFLRDEAFAAFAAGHRLGYTDTAAELARALRDTGPGDPVVAMVEAPGALAEWEKFWRPIQQALLDRGIRCHLGELDGLEVRGGRVYMGGDRIDVVYRCCDTDQVLADPVAFAQAERLFLAHASGEVVLWAPLESNLYCEKACLALMSGPGHRDAFSAEERALFDRVLPWTRVLTPDLIEECRARREELILKPSGLYGGKGVVPGWERTDAEWVTALRAELPAGAIVQDRVAPRGEPVPGQAEPWSAVYGFFYTPNGHAGVDARVAPARHSSVIGLTINETALPAGVFHVLDGVREDPCPS